MMYTVKVFHNDGKVDIYHFTKLALVLESIELTWARLRDQIQVLTPSMNQYPILISVRSLDGMLLLTCEEYVFPKPFTLSNTS